jgi:putative oxidoreductase
METHKLTDIALFIIRVAVGAIFVAHGMQKLFGAFGGSGIDGFASMLTNLGFTAPVFWAWVAALAEGAGGLFLILGVLPRISAGLIAATMVVAIVAVHGPKGFFAMKGGFEYQFLILMVCSALMITGSGKLSLYNKF